jgi:hypothetical protein
MYIIIIIIITVVFSGSAAQRGLWSPRSRSFRDYTQRRATVARTTLDEGSSRRRDLYLTTQNRHTSRPPLGFEPTIAAGERPYSYALDRAAAETGNYT